MFRPLFRILAFFGKEFNEVRRQPRLVLSLILGPFLILLVFGLAFRGTPPPLRVAMVVSQEDADDPRVQRVQQIIEDNFVLVATTNDEAEAEAMLRAGEVDVIEVFPPNIEERIVNGEQVWVAFRYDEINPLDEQWMQYTGYVQVNALNQAILMQTAGEMQDEAAEMSVLLAVAGEQLEQLNGGSSEQDRAEARESLSALQAAVGLLAANPALAQEALGEDASPEELAALQEDLTVLDQALESGDLEEQQARIDETQERITRLEELSRQLSETPSNVLVQPLQLEYQNVRGEALPLVNFYAPGVLALIVQHIAVTLGALSLVRERLLGAVEMFAVSPASMLQVLIGKIGAYTVFVGIIALVLVGLMVWGLGVPFLGSPVDMLITMFVFVLASIGVGLFISSLSSSDTQAVQLSMIVLLVSIFFSGFFLPLEQFYDFAKIIGYTLPITHGMNAFVDIMLLGRFAGFFELMMMALIFAVTVFLVIFIWGRHFRRFQA